MRTWRYSYKTPDGLRHEAEMTASCKDDVYAELRKHGIRAIKVEERIVPIERKGFSGLRKRDWFLIALLFAVLLGFSFLVIGKRSSSLVSSTGTIRNRGIESNIVEISPGKYIAKPRPRKQGVIAAIRATHVTPSDIFKYRSEALLAEFASPGVAPSNEILKITKNLPDDFFESFDEDIYIFPEDSKAVSDLKRVVAGLKQEAESFLESGKSVEDLIKWFVSRQKMEAAYRYQISERVKAGGLKIDEANSILSEMGLEELK